MPMATGRNMNSDVLESYETEHICGIKITTRERTGDGFAKKINSLKGTKHQKWICRPEMNTDK